MVIKPLAIAAPSAVSADVEPWPGVTDPAGLLAGIADWLSGYGNPLTRRTYGEGLGLPVTAEAIRTWQRPGETTVAWNDALDVYAAALRVSLAAPPRAVNRTAPPPAAPGRLRHLHWFRWCAARQLDPGLATTSHVKAWLDALTEAGAAPATRDRMLATVKALYGHLAGCGLAAANPAALSRRRLGLTAGAQSTSATVTLTSRQVAALHAAAATPRRGASPVDTARAAAVVTLFTLGLRVSELCGLDERDLHVTRGRRALRVHGKGGKSRVVYLSRPAEDALATYQARAGAPSTDVARRGTAVGKAAVAGTAVGEDRPLLRTRGGRRFQRQAIWQLLRRVAASSGDDLATVADALHPHALRHFYVTAAVEAGAQLDHVQADVGHSSIDTTRTVYDHAARDPGRSAVDLVTETWYPS
ncbi:tyrosine-type recombinase/integrase [Amycolatopsis jiangsuensis]|uniref:Site-specific recombinase XerD n=1 Tax=Amycolatopsis jiangsuensis TaxID=1181879 RepID=A0A840IQ76_9PSEU|nr:tyrosine-type recombinase/integrase [Amycolatopsis jiangsuensis]MBB4683537.1 site-specific recombinase XerD [Amycolatopsis jiangsuensis]